MRIAIQTLGTRGDIQPYLALAKGLVRSGHEVQIAAPEQFQALAAEHGIPFFGLNGEFLALMDTAQGKAAVAGGEGFSAGIKLLKYIRPLMLRLLEEEWEAVRSFAPDVLLYHPKSIASPYIAEALALRSILASPLPGFTPTSAFPTPMLPFASFGPLNRASHALAIRGGELLFSRELRGWRTRSLGLEGRRRSKGPVGTLYAYSSAVIPVPPDWGRDVLVSGYWFLDSEDWKPDPQLAGFLAAGEKPVYVGFGSMPGVDAERLTEMVVEALTRTGKRGLLATGGGALEAKSLPPHVHQMVGAPHDWLLPRVESAIHHGGAGTTAASLRAGIPTTIVPFFGDQPFWGRRVHQLGAGPPPLNRKSLTVENLAASMVTMESATMRQKAAAIGAAIEGEDGVGAAIRFIEKMAGG